MPSYVIDKRDFLKGLSQSEEVGGFFRDMQGINVHSQSGIGVLMNNSTEVVVYSEGSSTALTSPVTQLVRYAAGGTQAIAALSNNHAVRLRLNAVDGQDVSQVITFSGGNSTDKLGAATYKLGSQSSSNIGVFYAHDNDIGVYDTGGAFTTEQKWNASFMSTIPANASAIAGQTFTAMYHHKRHDVLYWNGGSLGNQVDKFDANVGVNGTLSENVLDLPADWQIRDFAQLRDYLAILATTPNNSAGSSDNEFVQLRSKVFFWDGIKDSWNYETPLINDHLMGLINTEDGLFAVGKGDGMSYYQIEFEQASRIFNWPKANIDISSGRRDGDDVANYRALDSIGNQLFLLGKDGNDAHVFSVGERFGVSKKNVFNKPFFLKSQSSTGVVDLGDLVAVNPSKFYASYHDDNGASADQYRIVRFSPGNANTTDARADTVELDSYFGGIGKLKSLKSIEFDIEPLKSGDILEVYKELNYAGSWTRLDGESSAGAGNSIRESDFSGENRTMIKFTRTDQFRHMRLRFDWTGGSVKIRRIKINFEYGE